MKKTLLILLLAISTLGMGKTQDYDTGIGVKIGMAPGISVKHFITTNAAFEGIATFRWRGANLTGLAEFHLPVFDTEGFTFYYGGGLHLGVWDSGIALGKAETGRKFNFGIDGVLGLEYAFPRLPLSLGLDWKPGFNIVTDPRLIIDEISLVARFLLK
jgi:hypothetical protein